MNQFDWEKMREEIEITNVSRVTDPDGINLTIRNNGSTTARVSSLWINNSTHHERYDIDLFINAGDSISYTHYNVFLPNSPFLYKLVTYRGNLAIILED